MALEIFSPMTLPIDPPIKLKSIQAITTSLPLDLPMAVRTASCRPDFILAALSRSLYF